MRFAEIDLLGVYVAPIAVMMLGAWVVLLGLTRVGAYLGVLSRVWHPSLFLFSVYIIVLSIIVLVEAGS